MGAIKSFIDGLDASKPEYNEQKELIEALAQLADAKADSFALQIEKYVAEAHSEYSKSLPVESWIDTTKETHAISTDSVEIEKVPGSNGTALRKEMRQKQWECGLRAPKTMLAKVSMRGTRFVAPPCV